MNELMITANVGAIAQLPEGELKKECMMIVSCMDEARNSLFNVAVILKDIKDNKRFSTVGYDRFGDFCEDVLGYKHAMVNNLVRIADRFLEASADNPKMISSIIVHDDVDYSVSQLQEVLSVDNEKVIEWDENGVITPDMTTKEIRQVVKAYKETEKEIEEAETETETAEETEQEVAEPEQEVTEQEIEKEHCIQDALVALESLKTFITSKKEISRIEKFVEFLNAI